MAKWIHLHFLRVHVCGPRAQKIKSVLNYNFQVYIVVETLSSQLRWWETAGDEAAQRDASRLTTCNNWVVRNIFRDMISSNYKKLIMRWDSKRELA